VLPSQACWTVCKPDFDDTSHMPAPWMSPSVLDLCAAADALIELFQRPLLASARALDALLVLHGAHPQIDPSQLAEDAFSPAHLSDAVPDRVHRALLPIVTLVNTLWQALAHAPQNSDAVSAARTMRSSVAARVLLRSSISNAPGRGRVAATASLESPLLTHADLRIVDLALPSNTSRLPHCIARLTSSIDTDACGCIPPLCPLLAGGCAGVHTPTSPPASHQVLIIAVHGLLGHDTDFLIWRNFLAWLHPSAEFYSCSSHTARTLDSAELQLDLLVDELLALWTLHRDSRPRVVLIGHSLGAVLARSLLSHRGLAEMMSRCYALVSLAGPHIGARECGHWAVGAGMWAMTTMGRAQAISELRLEDHQPPARVGMLARLAMSGWSALTTFGADADATDTCRHESARTVVLFGVTEDSYVPLHSALARGSNHNAAGAEHDLLSLVEQQLHGSACVRVAWSGVHRPDASAVSRWTGRAAHLALLEDEHLIYRCVRMLDDLWSEHPPSRLCTT
jgi:pimeloyl-ACP methyl ester carboxylesterase